VIRARLMAAARALSGVALLAAVALAGAVGAVGGCATLTPGGDSVPFRVETNVADATVWVDDRLVGSAVSLATPGTRVRIGFHRVEIRHPTHYSFFKEIEPKSGDDVVIRADLHELLQ
jgi:hypothetical protein